MDRAQFQGLGSRFAAQTPLTPQQAASPERHRGEVAIFNLACGTHIAWFAVGDGDYGAGSSQPCY